MSSKSYSQETLEQAIGLIKSGSMSLNGACKAYNIPLTTLGDKVRGRRPVKGKSKFLLTEEEEGKLVKWIGTQSLGKSPDDVKNKVKEILKLRGKTGRRDDGLPGKDWLINFKRRHPEITLQTPKALRKECVLVSGCNITSIHSSSSMSSKSYSQETLEQAIGLIKSGSMSLNGASKAYNIPLTTLGDKVRGRRPVKGKSKFLLTEEEEGKLVKWIGTQSLGKSPDDVKNKVKDILKLRGKTGRRDDGLPGKDWLINFKRRHPEITLQTPKALRKECVLVSGCNVSTKSITIPPSPNCVPPQPSTQSAMAITPTISNSASAVSTATHLLPSTSVYSIVPELSLMHSPSISTSASEAINNVEVLLRLSHKIGIERSVEFLNAIRENTSALQNDADFIPFQEIIAALSTGPKCTMTPVHLPQNLDSILAPPQLQRNKSGKASKKNSSMNIAVSSEKSRAFLKNKEDNVREEQEVEKKRKLDREQIKENRLREKRQKQEKMRLERENKKKEKHEKKKRDKQKLIEKRKVVERTGKKGRREKGFHE